MIFKKIFLLIVFLLFRIVLFSQNNTTTYAGSYHLDVDDLTVFKLDSLNKSIVHYYFVQKDIASCDIQFKGGYNSLINYCDSVYYNRSDYRELNARALYTIFFDRHLKIKEIRIIKRIAYDNSAYDELIKKILLSTEGKWTKLKNRDNSEWYFYYGFFNLR